MNLIPKNLSQLRRIALSVLLASFAILDTTSISAQELGRTITSPFGIARQTSTSESGSDRDTFIDPETGEVGHIIRNPFGVANPNDVDTGIDIPDDAGEEVGGIITSPFGVPASDDIDTGVDVLDEDEEYLISLPDEETDVDERESVEDEGNADDTLDDAKDLEEESYENTTEKYVPVIDNPIPNREWEDVDFKIVGLSGNIYVESNTDNPTIEHTLFVNAGNPFEVYTDIGEVGNFSSSSLVWQIESSLSSFNNMYIQPGTTRCEFTTDPNIPYGSLLIAISGNFNGQVITRKIRIEIMTIKFEFPNPIRPNGQTPEEAGYDTILITNIGRESSAFKPDYANFGARNGETSLIAANLKINTGNMIYGNCRISFHYDGVSSLDNIVRERMSESDVSNIFMRGSSIYWDYTKFKKDHKLRLWTSRSQSFTQKSQRNKTNYRDGGNYLAPSDFYNINSAYEYTSLFPGSNSSSNTKRIFIEGINPSSNPEEICATIEYLDYMTNNWYSTVSTTAKIMIIEGKILLNTNNDAAYALDEVDHKIKEQNGGFKGWFANEFNNNVLSDASTTYGLENMFPLFINKDALPVAPYGMRYELRLNHDGVIIPNPYGMSDELRLNHDGVIIQNPPALDRMCYLTDEEKSNNAKVTLSTLNGQHQTDIDFYPNSSSGEFLFCLFNNEGGSCENKISLVLCDNQNHCYEIDSSRYSFQTIDKYFWMGSTRGSAGPHTPPFNYPLEGDDWVWNFDVFPEVQRVTTFAESRDNRKNNLVFLHGFNVNEENAYDWNRKVFRRMYWSGFRDNYIGITWAGDYGVDPRPFFDTNVYRALQTSHSICEFLKDLKNTSQPERTTSIAAHSLGNLVMWDALRLSKIGHPSVEGNLVKNVVSIEGAVWEEAFFPQEDIFYNAPDDEATYVVDHLKRHSWAFWFQQNNGNATHACTTFVNSRTGADDALIGMKQWNNFQNGITAYNRNNDAPFRTPHASSLPEMSPLMQHGHRRTTIHYHYDGTYTESVSWTDLNNPIGLSNLHDTVSSWIPTLHFKDCDATQLGWRNDEHSDIINREFFHIKPWFDDVFHTKTHIIPSMEQ